jgi:hypothetical protein
MLKIKGIKQLCSVMGLHAQQNKKHLCNYKLAENLPFLHDPLYDKKILGVVHDTSLPIKNQNQQY